MAKRRNLGFLEIKKPTDAPDSAPRALRRKLELKDEQGEEHPILSAKAEKLELERQEEQKESDDLRKAKIDAVLSAHRENEKREASLQRNLEFNAERDEVLRKSEEHFERGLVYGRVFLRVSFALTLIYIGLQGIMRLVWLKDAPPARRQVIWSNFELQLQHALPLVAATAAIYAVIWFLRRGKKPAQAKLLPALGMAATLTSVLAFAAFSGASTLGALEALTLGFLANRLRLLRAKLVPQIDTESWMPYLVSTVTVAMVISYILAFVAFFVPLPYPLILLPLLYICAILVSAFMTFVTR